MNLLRLLLFITCLFFSFSNSVLADDNYVLGAGVHGPRKNFLSEPRNMQKNPEICEDPYRAICIRDVEKVKSEKQRIEEASKKLRHLKTESEKEATDRKEDLKSEIALIDAEFKRLRLEISKEGLESRALNRIAERIFYAKMEKMYALPEQDLRETKDFLRSSTKAGKELGFDPEHIGKMLSSISFKTWNDHLKTDQGRIQLYGTCGIAGQNLSAMLSTERPELLLCPGLIENSRQSDEKTEGKHARVPFVLAHEVAHSFDYQWFPKAYGKMKDCLYELYGSREGDNEKQFEQRMREISADYWGAAALAQRARLLKNIDQRVSLIRNTLSMFCRTEEEREEKNSRYPASRLRITMIARWPALQESMGCPASSATNPLCSIDGKLPK